VNVCGASDFVAGLIFGLFYRGRAPTPQTDVSDAVPGAA
jgi:hypothetical protein